MQVMGLSLTKVNRYFSLPHVASNSFFHGVLCSTTLYVPFILFGCCDSPPKFLSGLMPELVEQW